MPQRNPLGPSRTSASVENKGNIVRGRRGRFCTGRSIHNASNSLLRHLNRKSRYLAVGCSRAHKLCSDRRAEQNPGVGITQEKMEFFIGVSRIQWSSDSGDGG